MKLLSVISAVLMLICAPLRADSVGDAQARNADLPDYRVLHEKTYDATKPMMWLFLGDSITHGCLHTHGGRSYPEHWMEIVKWEIMREKQTQRTNDLVINAGVSSETAHGFLNHMEWRLNQFCPDVVFINFGINDGDRFGDTEQFRADLTRIARQVRAKNAIPVLQTNSLTLRAKPFRPHFNAVIREVAAAENSLLVDHAAAWEEAAGKPGASAGSKRESVPAPRHLMNNDLHPNAAGHLFMAQTIARSLNLIPVNSPTLQRAVK